VRASLGCYGVPPEAWRVNGESHRRLGRLRVHWCHEFSTDGPPSAFLQLETSTFPSC